MREARVFDQLRRELHDISKKEKGFEPTEPVRTDPDRKKRSGIPEVVFAEHKSPDMVVLALATLATTNGRAIASRCSPETFQKIVDELGSTFDVTQHELARAAVVSRPRASIRSTGGRVGIITAGSSDVPIAAEAALMAREMGTDVSEIWDVGVAGLHRLVAPLEQLMLEGVDAIVVAAGMDGALPSVVAGLVDVPVIGLPTSVGYGYGGQGVGALMAMLQTCAPGLVVVNIDNGIGAGSTAALIANRVAAARASALHDSSDDGVSTEPTEASD